MKDSVQEAIGCVQTWPIKRDMTPGELASHAARVCAVWLAVYIGALFVDAAQFGGPLEATLAFFIPGLIHILILHLTMFEMLYKDEKNARRFAEQEVRLSRLEKERMEDREIIRKLRDDLKRAGLSR